MELFYAIILYLLNWARRKNYLKVIGNFYQDKMNQTTYMYIVSAASWSPFQIHHDFDS